MTKAKHQPRNPRRRSQLIFTAKLDRGDMREPACAGSEIDFVGPDLEDNSDKVYREAEAKAVCARCDLRSECLIWALGSNGNPVEVGIWGGLNDDERRAIRTGRNYTKIFGLATKQQRDRDERENRAWALFNEGRTSLEIADEIGVTEGTVYVYIRNQRRVHDHEARSNPDRQAAEQTEGLDGSGSSDPDREKASLLAKIG